MLEGLFTPQEDEIIKKFSLHELKWKTASTGPYLMMVGTLAS